MIPRACVPCMHACRACVHACVRVLRACVRLLLGKDVQMRIIRSSLYLTSYTPYPIPLRIPGPTSNGSQTGLAQTIALLLMMSAALVVVIKVMSDVAIEAGEDW